MIIRSYKLNIKIIIHNSNDFQIFNEPVVDPQTIDLLSIESTLRNKLLPFQEEGVR